MVIDTPEFTLYKLARLVLIEVRYSNLRDGTRV